MIRKLMLAAASREGIRCWHTGAHRDAAPMNGEYPLALPVEEFGEFPSGSASSDAHQTLA